MTHKWTYGEVKTTIKKYLGAEIDKYPACIKIRDESGKEYVANITELSMSYADKCFYFCAEMEDLYNA